MIEQLLKLADSLDRKGLYREADELDEMINEFKDEIAKTVKEALPSVIEKLKSNGYVIGETISDDENWDIVVESKEDVWFVDEKGGGIFNNPPQEEEEERTATKAHWPFLVSISRRTVSTGNDCYLSSAGFTEEQALSTEHLTWDDIEKMGKPIADLLGYENKC